MKIQSIALFLIVSISTANAGSVVRFNHQNKTFKNKNCLATNTCDLKEFNLNSYDYKVNFKHQSPSYGSNLYSSYKTEKIEDLQNYVIVQYIKGCQYHSFVEDGKVKYGFNILREFFGGFAKFVHKEWVVDSIDDDPVYNSTERGRHFAYKWNTVPDSYDKKTQKYYGVERPTTPRLYISDLPSTAFAGKYEAKNISLKFKTCIYKNQDVPSVVSPTTNIDNAIKCYTWQSSFIYDHQKKSYYSSNKISKACELAP